jgi:hypothetical protein
VDGSGTWLDRSGTHPSVLLRHPSRVLYFLQRVHPPPKIRPSVSGPTRDFTQKAPQASPGDVVLRDRQHRPLCWLVSTFSRLCDNRSALNRRFGMLPGVPRARFDV